ncbi:MULTISPECIES: hypothetical protein [Pseudonocardia]|uniref:Uncharacterized protein n=2 Tax=Pseudonocardia TaxID=1847 RepID=A0A1Y2MLI0_PSEAH|nr:MULTISPECIES: hypothetical protein [Pseudonocardia]OSY36100.1 hypothetical protein BG845_05615 [Pseudonocardia autotrophica]TDN77582.1 hypothetical protein C8E95_6831 [Pseudonocardia autotrophica]BBG01612.1 hypothetical protein Pdca_28210 [Pseudonocardia autotrophica]GEC25357.1 hypothetical protein PSA01_23860 [Pseudonocardia saturnea]
MSADDQRAAPWTVRHVDGWWCVYFSDGSLGAQFAIEGDARTFADVAGPGEGTVILRSDLDRLRAELDRLHSWDGLMSLLDEHWPVDIFRADPMEAAADPGPRIIALLRWVAALRDAGNPLADSVSRFLMSPEDHDDRANMQDAARAWRSAAGGEARG